ncbi:thioredoxin family protein [Barnesiella sp.]|uniref:TlpA family protein disulfide reductase n=1 Tax=Barnesiella sp. TaxID=2033407 RepID=UPI0025902426|nr:thioredoxin family protein [Barnesiella sp.]
MVRIVYNCVKQLFERYDKRQFSIVGISFDTNREEWKEYIQKNQIKWAQLIDQKGWESTAILTYAIQGIPHLILLGPDGKIIANNPSEKQLSNILSNQLKQ